MSLPATYHRRGVFWPTGPQRASKISHRRQRACADARPPGTSVKIARRTFVKRHTGTTEGDLFASQFPRRSVARRRRRFRIEVIGVLQAFDSKVESRSGHRLSRRPAAKYDVASHLRRTRTPRIEPRAEARWYQPAMHRIRSRLDESRVHYQEL